VIVNVDLFPRPTLPPARFVANPAGKRAQFLGFRLLGSGNPQPKGHMNDEQAYPRRDGNRACDERRHGCAALDDAGRCNSGNARDTGSAGNAGGSVDGRRGNARDGRYPSRSGNTASNFDGEQHKHQR
jgi:hypothetical protein